MLSAEIFSVTVMYLIMPNVLESGVIDLYWNLMYHAVLFLGSYPALESS